MLSMVDGVEQLQRSSSASTCRSFRLRARAARDLRVHGLVDLPVACVILVAAIFTLRLPALSHRWDSRDGLARQKAYEAYGEEFLDAVQGLPTLKAFGQSQRTPGCSRSEARALPEHDVGARHQHSPAASPISASRSARRSRSRSGAYRVHGEMSWRRCVVS